MGRRKTGLVFGFWVFLLLVAVFGVMLDIPLGSGTGDSWVWVRDTITGAFGEAVIGTGEDLYIARGTSFYRYRPADGSWAAMAAPPSPDGAAFKTGTALAWDGSSYIYALYGSAGGESRRWFYRYSTSGNSWEALAETPADQGEGDAITWVSLNNHIYATIGGEERSTYFVRYDPNTNTWSDAAVADPPAGMGDGASLVWTGSNYLYALRGEFYETTALYDFWRYELAANTWTSMADIPATPHDGGVGGVGDGGSLLYIGLWLSNQTDFIYALSGNQAYPESPQPIPDNRFYRYTISTNSWERLADLPFGIGYYVGCRLGYANEHIYAWQGAPSTWAGGGNDLAQYEFPIPSPPVADFSYSPEFPTVDATVTFDASASYDPDGGYIVSYVWDFGDGNSGNGKIATHVYAAVGTYTVTLTITDDESQTDTDSQILTVQKTGSTITIKASPDTIEIGTSTTLSGSITPTKIGVTITIWYRLSGETTWNVLTSSITDSESKYSYMWTPTAIGTYELKVSWTGDDKTLSAESEIKTVIVTPPDSTPPTTNISLSGVLGNNGWFTSTVTVTLSAIDDISGVDKTEYSFDNTTWTTYATPFTITNEGNITVYYRSTDKAGNTEAIKTLKIKIDKTTPSANAGQDQTVEIGATVNFDAGGSTDNVGVVSYEWGFGDEATGTGKTATHTYAYAGTYTVTLTVKDAAGNTATDTITITVRSAEAPPPPPEAFLMWIIAAAITIIGIAVAATLLLRKRK